MLTNLDFLNEGGKWPPRDEKKRLKRYEDNRKLFTGEHAVVYENQLRRIERVLGEYMDVVSYPIVLNYHKLISLKIADLMLGEAPEFNADSEDGTKALNEMLYRLRFNSELYKNIIDISRFGEGIPAVGKDENQNARLSIVQPSHWYAVVDPLNITRIINHVIDCVEYIEQDGRMQPRSITFQIHYPGYYIERVHSFNGNEIGKRLKADRKVGTGLPGFAVFPLQGIVTTDSVYGIDDYEQIDSIISELEIRVAQISKILDTHASPSMQGPESALEEDDFGNYRVRAGKYFINDGVDNKDVGYLTWDGQLAAAYEMVKTLRNQLYSLSELGGILLGDPDHIAGVSSAKALKLRMVSPLAKVQRIVANITPTLCDLLSALTILDKDCRVKLNPEDISINWFDGLPNDELEDQQIIQLQNGGERTMSHLRSIMQANNMSESQAEDELAAILADNQTDMPTAYEQGITDDENDTEDDNE